MMRGAFVRLLLAGLLGGAPAAGAQERIQIEVESGSGRGYQVAVQSFLPRRGGFTHSEPFHSALVGGLNFSGALEVVDEAAFLEPRQTASLRGRIDCANWRGIGADGLVQGILEVRGRELVATYRVWDTVRCRLQGSVTESRRALRERELLARSIADEIVRRFTGKRGVSYPKIAFVSDGDGQGNKEIYLMEADGGNQHAVTDNGSINLFPSWAPDGRSLVYTSFKSGRSDIWKIYRGSIPGHPLLAERAEKFRAVFDARSGRLGLVMSRGGNTDLYSVDASGAGLERLTGSRSIETSPSFSPDGRRMAFVSDRGGAPQVYLKDLGTGEERRLTFRGGYNSSPAWSPTGEWIAYTARTSGGFDLYLIDPDTGFTTPLVVHPRSDEAPSWSPDGRKIAFSSTRRGRQEIYRIDVDGRNLVRMTARFGNSSHPAWSGFLE